jgi:hypothetical protein
MSRIKPLALFLLALTAGTSMLIAQIKVDTNKLFSFPEHGFAAAFPKKPVKTKPKYTEDSTAFNVAYTLVDSKLGIYYQCLVQDLAKGFFLSADSAVFDSYKNGMLSNESTEIVSERRGVYQNYPAMWMDIKMTIDGEESYNRLLTVHRGNRRIFLFAIMPGTEPNDELMNKFINSLQLIPVIEKNWSKQSNSQGEFSVWAPDSITLDTNYTNTYNSIYALDEFYKSYDSTTPATVYVEKLRYSPYYWAENDTVLLRKEINGAMEGTDSLLEYKVFRQGSYTIADALLRMNDNHNKKKIRFVLSGDFLYKLFVILPDEWLKINNYQKFFTDFIPVNKASDNRLFTSKSKELLGALQTKDSVGFEQAKYMLDYVNFTAADIPGLHEALLKKRIDDTSGYTTATILLSNIITDLKDERTEKFAAESYKNTAVDAKMYSYELLCLLASRKTASSYTLINDLLKSKLPSGENIYRFSRLLYDSLSLSAPLLPSLMPLLKDTMSATQVLDFAETMIDSGFIKANFLNKYKPDIFKLAGSTLEKLKQNADLEDVYKYHVLIRILAAMNTSDAIAYINQFAVQKNIHLKYTAVLSLVKINKPVNAQHLLQLAASNVYRNTLFDDLKKEKKLSLFPKKYLNQQALAESDLYNYIVEDNDIQKLQFLGERIVNYMGKKSRFYLFKADMSGEEEKNIKLAVAGPYSIKPVAALITYPTALGVYWDEEFRTNGMDNLLNAYLQLLEKQQQNAEVEGGK